jgi:hypothetical protein
MARRLAFSSQPPCHRAVAASARSGTVAFRSGCAAGRRRFAGGLRRRHCGARWCGAHARPRGPPRPRAPGNVAADSTLEAGFRFCVDSGAPARSGDRRTPSVLHPPACEARRPAQPWLRRRRGYQVPPDVRVELGPAAGGNVAAPRIRPGPPCGPGWFRGADRSGRCLRPDSFGAKGEGAPGAPASGAPSVPEPVRLRRAATHQDERNG